MTEALLEAGSSSSSTVAPRWATARNPLRPSYGPAVVTAARLLGLELMPWQVYVLTVGLEVQSVEAGDPAPGEWAYDEVDVSVPRQAGKSYLLRPLVVHRLRMLKRARVWSTAQSRVHARRRWLDVTEALLSSPLGQEFRRLTGVGHEEFRERSTQSTLEPFAPNGESLHGETPDLVLVDEKWAFDAEEARLLRQAYVPGFTTRDGQAWGFSTAGTERSAWLNGTRRRGRRAVEEGRQLGLAWFEWTLPDEVDGVPVEDLPDEDLVRLCIEYHPARGYTLRERSVWSAWETMTEDDPAAGRREFIRAYGNRTASSSSSRVIPEEAYRASRTREPIPADAAVSFAFEVDVDGEDAAVYAAAQLPGGRRLVELVDHAEGTRWLVPRLVELSERHGAPVWCIDGSGPTRDAADALERLGVEVHKIPGTDYGAAVARFEAEVTARDEEGRYAPTILHRGEPELDGATKAAGRRSSGRVRVWARGSAPISALVAATVSVWAVDHAPEPEGRFVIG